MNTNQTNILEKFIDTDKLFENIEKHPEFIKKLNIRSVPTLVYCEGESIQSLSAGFKTQSQIEKWIANNS